MSFRLAQDVDPQPHLPVEYGRTGEGVGRWVPEMKHTFLAKYVEGTRRAREKFRQRVYVDLFCGPGRIQVKGETMTRPGGAQIAWAHSLLDGAAFTSCLIGDLDSSRAHACAERLKGMGAPVVAFPGAAESTVDQILEAIPRSSLCLAYLDPYNLQYLSFNVIKKLAGLKYVDFAVHFSTMDLRRNVLMEYNPDRARFDAAAPGWRQHVDPVAFLRGDADEAFFNYWCDLVQGLGFTISRRMPLVRDDGNRPLYHLVFFSRHELPNRIWGDVAQGQNREFNF
ncbi:three-Cys-motif partner protein TcmP [Pusillimonas sp. MFBS29]|uniref:three-Cys-motif partner protein TcmP n=1 Tax=Pusillimonas sp. MFBS29 TaxID=2886690 RepID=UPI001D11E9C2|nr:three-Cys-motif partner protein TcmP [Pusillimonas sp. MFBS29]MCC2594732.1 three-Cys-motif partner protein TcmP [Pusillimonas sp. MFBS29]